MNRAVEYSIVLIFLLIIAMMVCAVGFLSYIAGFSAETWKEINQMHQQLEESKKFREEIRNFLNRLEVGEFEATAYSPHDDRNGLNSWRPKLASRSYTPRTKTGTIPRHGTVAVDPEVIPLGSRLWVEGYGFARAEDTGGAIRGKRIDLYVDSFDTAMRHGRKPVKVIWMRRDGGNEK